MSTAQKTSDSGRRNRAINILRGTSLVIAGWVGVTIALAAHMYTIDGLYYLGDLRRADWAELLHPHHLLMEASYFGWVRLWPGSDIVALQVLTTLLTAGGLVIFARTVRRVIACESLVVLAVVWLATTNVVWVQATQPDAGPWFWFFCAVNLAWAVRLAAGVAETRTVGYLIVTTALGILFHQSLALAAPVLAAILAVHAPRGRRLAMAATMLVGTGALVLAVYGLAGFVSTGSLAPAVLWQWATGYREEFANRCGQLRLMVSSEVPRGLGTALLGAEPLKPYMYGGRGLDGHLGAVMLPFAAVGGVLLAGGAGLLARWREATALTRRQLVAVIALGLAAALFAAWWDPAQRKFWTPVVPALVLVALWGWDRALCSRLGSRLAVGVVASVVLVSLGWNLANTILPRHGFHDATQPLVAFLQASVGAGDTVILREDRVWQCATYFAPDAPVYGIPGALSDRLDPQESVWYDAVAAASVSLAGDHHVWVADSQLARLRRALEPRFGNLATRAVLTYRDEDLGPVAPLQTCYAVTLANGLTGGAAH